MHLQALSALSDNYIWLLTDDDGRSLVVDPGEAEPVLTAADRDGLRPAAVLLTHHHGDHIAGTVELVRRWPGLPVIGPDDDRPGLAMRRMHDGERLEVESWALEALHVPGHTRTHIAFRVSASDGKADDILFCGDTLFSLGCGRLFEGTPAQMQASLARLGALSGGTRVCCGHEYTLANAEFALRVEPDNQALRRRQAEAQSLRDRGRPTLPSTIASERACNPFLRWDSPAVVASVAERLGRTPADEIETFAELRRWKDGFSA